LHNRRANETEGNHRMTPKQKKGLIAAAMAAAGTIAIAFGIDPRIVGIITELLNQVAQ
jgi:hypothetical protein